METFLPLILVYVRSACLPSCVWSCSCQIWEPRNHHKWTPLVRKENDETTEVWKRRKSKRTGGIRTHKCETWGLFKTLIWKYENMVIFPIAIILRKNVGKQSYFSSLLKLIDKCHSWFQKQLTLNDSLSSNEEVSHHSTSTSRGVFL